MSGLPVSNPATISETSARRSLVTGGAGFIGSHLVEALVARGRHVTVIDDESTGRVENLAAVAGHPRLRYVKGSVADRPLMHDLLADADEVFHLAAAVGVQLIANDPIHTIETNVYPTGLLLDELAALHRAGRPVRFFLASTSEVYGKNPKSTWTEDDDLVFGPTSRARWSYGTSKAIDEFLALAHFRQHGLPVVVGRLFNVVGPRQRGDYGMVLPRFVAAALAGGPVVVHDDGLQQRCFAHVSDVVRTITTLVEQQASVGQIFNIGSDQPVTILELAQRVIAAVDPRLEIEFRSYAAAYSSDFEDCRRRVPDLSRVRAAIPYALRYDLDAIIADVIAYQQSSASSR